MASELLAARTYLYGKLSAALAIPAFPLGEVSAGQAMPYATYDLTPEPDTASKTRTEQAAMEAVVRVVGQGSLVPLEAHQAAIETALNFRSGKVKGFRVESRRTATFALPVYFREGSNVPVREVGGRFELTLTRVESGVVG